MISRVAVGEAALARGASFRKAEVRAAAARWATACTSSSPTARRSRAGKVVVAGGAWSQALTAPLGDLIPLDTERGYNTTLPPGSFDLSAS